MTIVDFESLKNKSVDKSRNNNKEVEDEKTYLYYVAGIWIDENGFNTGGANAIVALIGSADILDGTINAGVMANLEVAFKEKSRENAPRTVDAMITNVIPLGLETEENNRELYYKIKRKEENDD